MDSLFKVQKSPSVGRAEGDGQRSPGFMPQYDVRRTTDDGPRSMLQQAFDVLVDVFVIGKNYHENSFYAKWVEILAG